MPEPVCYKSVVGVSVEHAHTLNYTELMAEEEIQGNENMDVDATAELTPMQMMAVSVHEMYTAFVFAGFDNDQAMYLTVETMRNGVEELRENIDDEED